MCLCIDVLACLCSAFIHRHSESFVSGFEAGASSCGLYSEAKFGAESLSMFWLLSLCVDVSMCLQSDL